MIEKDNSCNVVFSVNKPEENDLLSELEKEGCCIYKISCKGAAADFFKEAKQTLPLDPPLSGKVNWDTFSDSLWGGVDFLSQKKIAIVLEDVDQMKRIDPSAYEIAIDCITDVAEDFELVDHSEADKKIVRLVLVESDKTH